MFNRVRARARRARIALLLLAFAGWQLSPMALAHAIVVTASPVAKAELVGPAVPIDLEFNSRIDASRSSLAVLNSRGQPTPLEIDLSAPANHLRAIAEDLAPGNYVLEWYVLSTDGHITRGRLKFSVIHSG